MSIFGVSLILILGVANFILIWFQLASGRRWIKVPISVHRKTGVALVVCGTAHAALAALASL